MAEEKNTQTTTENAPPPQKGKDIRSRSHPQQPRGRRSRNDQNRREDDEFDQKIIDLARVTRVMKGGKRMRFRAAVAIGDHKGKVGFAVAKGADVSMAIGKASRKARKELVSVSMRNDTIPHAIKFKYKAANVLLKPAGKGRGVKAGGAMRIILELAGIPNVTGKMMGSPNKVNNSRATICALADLKKKKGKK